MKRDNYNYLISNIILSKQTFEYNDILNEIKTIFNDDSDYAIQVLNEALIRMTCCGFLTILGNTYTVLYIKI